jgi:hypothetical protein
MAEVASRPTEIIALGRCEICGDTAEWHTGYTDHLAQYHRDKWIHDPPHWLCQKHRYKWYNFKEGNEDFFDLIARDQYGDMTSYGFQAFLEVFLSRQRRRAVGGKHDRRGREARRQGQKVQLAGPGD